jgi:signal transduction histidine kinase
MMKTATFNTLIILLSLLYPAGGYPQHKTVDSLKKILEIQKEDSNKVKLLTQLSHFYAGSYADTGLRYAQQALELAEKLNYEEGIFDAEFNLSGSLATLGNYPLAINYGFKARSLAKKMNRPLLLMLANSVLAEDYLQLDEYQTSLKYYREVLNTAQHVNSDQIYFVWIFLSKVFEKMNQSDSAMIYAKKAYEKIRDHQDLDEKSLISPILGNAYASNAKYDSALFYYQTGISLAIKNQTQIDLVDNYNGIARVYKATGILDSAIWYSKKVLTEKITKSYPIGLLRAANMLAIIYELKKKPDSTLKYLRVATGIKDSLFNREKTVAIENLAFKEKEKEKELLSAKLKQTNDLKIYALLGGLLLFIIIATILFLNNKHRQKALAILQQQKQEIYLQKIKVEHVLNELKSTQAQLIQSEKMASLGELTAGIAHEIQNPLNFINNFSEVNRELLDEMKDEIENGNLNEVKAIAHDIIDNEIKINHHGKRADAIVKGMLQHSRSSSGVKEFTDINALADEYLRLAYHGLRAKDKSFNATLKTDFDKSIGSINIIPQDIGRVVLNLITNAFYAVDEKKKQGESNYEPTVTVSTKALKSTSGDSRVLVSVKDNGNGIPGKILDKIFQPFFTTKPTGQGTGLGLSLSYDIIKAHGGELNVETAEALGSEFMILLPFK